MSAVDKSNAVFRAMALDDMIKNAITSPGGCDGSCKSSNRFGASGGALFAQIWTSRKGSVLYVCTKCRQTYWYNGTHYLSIDAVPKYVRKAAFQE